MATVLVIGSGGREHALGWKLSQSPQVSRVLYAPGNGGTAEGKGENLPFNGALRENFSKVRDTIEQENVALTVVGPEAPLAEGLVDYLHSYDITQVFGPSQEASLLEADKAYSFELMNELGLPQAQGTICETREEALNAIDEWLSPRGVVLKACGLAAGKGVVVADNKEEARRELDELFQRFGPKIMVCERLAGQEFSVFGISDGENVVPWPVSFQDHKRLMNQDRGPNTGGMGAYGPTPIAPLEMVQRINDEVMLPIVQAMKARKSPFVGFLYTGVMLTEDGPKILEFNVRFGDPECQPAMMLLKSDLYEVLQSALQGNLTTEQLVFHEGAACCVVLASNGYPGSYTKGLPISGLPATEADTFKVFHAGTSQAEGGLVTSGGRVLGVTALSEKGLSAAQQQVYEQIDNIQIPGGFVYRTDIADKALKGTP